MDILAAMRIFVRVVERRNASLAARDLGMAQATVSERIAKLEAHLGEQLLNRSTRSMRPTDVGLEFYERARKVLDAAKFAESVGSKHSETLRGKVCIAAPQAIGEMLLPQILLRFRKRHPDVKVALTLNDEIASPTNVGADVSIRLGDRPAPDCSDEGVGFVRRVLVASPRYLAEYGRPTVPEELAEHAFMRVDGIFTDERLPLQRQGRAFDAPIQTAWTVSHWRLLYTLLLGGGGIGVLQMPTCADALVAGQLKRLLPQYEVPGFRLRLLHPSTQTATPEAMQLLVFLREEFQFLRDEE